MSELFNSVENLGSSESNDSSSLECEVPNTSECKENMSKLFKSVKNLWSSESEDSSSLECEVPNTSESKEAMPEHLKSLVNELQDILRAEEAAESSSQKENSSTLEMNVSIEKEIKEYTYNTMPPLRNIKERKLLPSPLKNWNKEDIMMSEKYTKLKRRYFDELNDFINKWRHQEKDAELNPIKKESSLSYFFSDMMLAISTELSKTDVKPLLLLKAFYYFFSNFEILFENHANLKMKCIVSLMKFVTNTLTFISSKYLLKDIAADILSEFDCLSLTNSRSKLFTDNLFNLQNSHEDLYGTTIVCLSNLAAETTAKLIYCETQFSDTLALAALNSPKMLRRLILVCESNICCSPSQLENLSLTERMNMLNQSEDNQIPSQIEIDDVPTQKGDALLARKKFYNRNLVTHFNDLIRHETIYTPVFSFKYEPRISKPFNFSDLIFNEVERSIEKYAAEQYPNLFVKKKTEDAFVKSKDLQEDTDSPKRFFITEHKESYISESSFWDSWDIFSDFKTHVDTQLAYFGNISSLENLKSDIYSREKANTHQISVSPSDMDPMNVKASPNVFDHFKMPDSYTVFLQNEKPPRKRKLSPSA